MINRIIFIIVGLIAGGCSTLNILETDQDHTRTWFATELKEGIDEAIKNELAGLRPNGIESGIDQPWQRYWRHKIQWLSENSLSEIKGYKGPDAQWFIDYIIRERKNAGLPELKTIERNQSPEPTPPS